MNKSSGSRQSQESLAKIKQILLADDQKRIDSLKKELEELQAHIQDKELLIETLEPVIAELMEKKIIASKHEMAEVLSPVMSEAIKNQIEYAKDEVVDALYPVIGKTIRRSISEAMRNLVKTVNDRVERAISLRWLFKRIKAKVSGVSHGDMILKESIPFQIHEIFLIHKETGILVGHVSEHSSQPGAEQELISGMLTAIKDFAQTLFSGEEGRELHEVQYEDRQIRLEMGQFAYLACITSGIPPEGFADEIAQLIHKIHRTFFQVLRNFDGDIDVFKPAQPLLIRFLHLFDRHADSDVVSEEVGPRRLRWSVFVLVGFLVVFLGLLLGIFVIPNAVTKGRVERALVELESEHPFLAEADIQTRVRRRNVEVWGYVQRPDEKDVIENRLASLSSVRKVNNRIDVLPWAIDPDRLHEQVRKSLAESLVDISLLKFVIEGGRLYLKGSVKNPEEKAKIIDALTQHTTLPVIVDSLRFDGALSVQSVMEEIEESVLYFPTGQSELGPQELAKLSEIKDKLAVIDFLRLDIIGHADDTGTDDVNLYISQMRADWIRSYFIENGIPENKLTVVARGSTEPVTEAKTLQARALNRRVVFVFRREE